MNERKYTTLNRTAQKCGVSIITIVDFLSIKGIIILPKPSSKLSLEVDDLIVKEFGLKQVKKSNKKKGYRYVSPPQIEDLLQKLRTICIGQSVRKIAMVLEIEEDMVLRIFEKELPNVKLTHRLTENDFSALEPKFKEYLQLYIENLPRFQKLSKPYKKKSLNPSPPIFKNSITKIFYTNM